MSQLREIIDLFDGDCTIGVHGVGSPSVDNEGLSFIDMCEKIKSEGLKLYGWGGLLSSVSIFGQAKNADDRVLSAMAEKAYTIQSDGTIGNVLFAFPNTITTSSGKEIFLGHFKDLPGANKGQDEAGASLPLCLITEKLGYIPKEFIAGYYITKANTTDLTFVPNRSFYMFTGKREELGDWIEQKMDECMIPDPESELAFRSKFPAMSEQMPKSEYIRQYEEYVKSKDKTL